MDLTLLLPRRTIEITEMGTLHQKRQQKKTCHQHPETSTSTTHTHTQSMSHENIFLFNNKHLFCLHTTSFSILFLLFGIFFWVCYPDVSQLPPTITGTSRSRGFSDSNFSMQCFAMDPPQRIFQLTCCWKVLHKWETHNYTSDDD